MPSPAPGAREKREVTVSRQLLWALAAAAIAFALATAFLLGRLTSGSTAAPPRPAPTSPAAVTGEPAVGDPALGPTPATGEPAHAAVPEASPAPSETAPAPSPASHGIEASPERQDVLRYFATIDGLLQGQGLSGDPQALAQKLVQQAAGGDTSGLESLVAAQQEATRVLRQLVPPAPCAEHHRRTLALTEKALTLVQQVKSALAGGDPGLLLQLSSLGRDAEQEARQLQALDRQLRQTWGVPTRP